MQLYLGDGVIATFLKERDQIELRTSDGNNQVIYLDSSTYRSLTEFVKRCWPHEYKET